MAPSSMSLGKLLERQIPGFSKAGTQQAVLPCFPGDAGMHPYSRTNDRKHYKPMEMAISQKHQLKNKELGRVYNFKDKYTCRTYCLIVMCTFLAFYPQKSSTCTSMRRNITRLESVNHQSGPRGQQIYNPPRPALSVGSTRELSMCPSISVLYLCTVLGRTGEIVPQSLSAGLNSGASVEKGSLLGTFSLCSVSVLKQAVFSIMKLSSVFQQEKDIPLGEKPLTLPIVFRSCCSFYCTCWQFLCFIFFLSFWFCLG